MGYSAYGYGDSDDDGGDDEDGHDDDEEDDENGGNDNAHGGDNRKMAAHHKDHGTSTTMKKRKSRRPSDQTVHARMYKVSPHSHGHHLKKLGHRLKFKRMAMERKRKSYLHNSHRGETKTLLARGHVVRRAFVKHHKATKQQHHKATGHNKGTHVHVHRLNGPQKHKYKVPGTPSSWLAARAKIEGKHHLRIPGVTMGHYMGPGGSFIRREPKKQLGQTWAGDGGDGGGGYGESPSTDGYFMQMETSVSVTTKAKKEVECSFCDTSVKKTSLIIGEDDAPCESGAERVCRVKKTIRCERLCFLIGMRGRAIRGEPQFENGFQEGFCPVGKIIRPLPGQGMDFQDTRMNVTDDITVFTKKDAPVELPVTLVNLTDSMKHLAPDVQRQVLSDNYDSDDPNLKLCCFPGCVLPKENEDGTDFPWYWHESTGVTEEITEENAEERGSKLILQETASIQVAHTF